MRLLSRVHLPYLFLFSFFGRPRAAVPVKGTSPLNDSSRVVLFVIFTLSFAGSFGSSDWLIDSIDCRTLTDPSGPRCEKYARAMHCAHVVQQEGGRDLPPSFQNRSHCENYLSINTVVLLVLALVFLSSCLGREKANPGNRRYRRIVSYVCSSRRILSEYVATSPGADLYRASLMRHASSFSSPSSCYVPHSGGQNRSRSCTADSGVTEMVLAL